MSAYIGTSGWQYKHWRGHFYPKDVRESDLEYYAERFRTVEVNNTFYRLPEADTFEAWAKRAPDDFIFAIKASRYLTHILRLKEPDEAVERMLTRARKLGSKLGPVLLQLPPTLRRDDGRLCDTLRALHGVRVAVEFRHDSWYTHEVRALLERHDAALCIADRKSRLITPAWRTADWAYVRFHYGLGKPEGCYGSDALAARARLLREQWGADCDAYVYFNNDGHACALRDARVFAAAAERVGLEATRVPASRDVRVG